MQGKPILPTPPSFERLPRQVHALWARPTFLQCSQLSVPNHSKDESTLASMTAGTLPGSSRSWSSQREAGEYAQMPRCTQKRRNGSGCRRGVWHGTIRLFHNAVLLFRYPLSLQPHASASNFDEHNNRIAALKLHIHGFRYPTSGE